jgi:hypothetical protein
VCILNTLCCQGVRGGGGYGTGRGYIVGRFAYPLWTRRTTVDALVVVVLFLNFQQLS